MTDDVIKFGRGEQDSLMKSVTLMNEVAKRLKQVPELPSEKPTDSHPLTKVEFPDENGVFTYMDGYDYPYRGYPYYEFVEKIDLVKKLSRSLQSGFYHGLKKTKFKWVLIPLIPTVGRSVFWACTYTFHRLIDRFQVRTNRYSQFVGELHRAFSVSWGDENPRITELRKMIRDIECMILEMDNAYRFRAQDLLPELDKEALTKNPVREINRLLDIWISRELNEDVKNSWRLLKLFVTWYLRFDRPLLKMFQRILLELDIEKCSLTSEDKYYSVPRKDYVFGFMTNPTEQDTVLIAKVRLQKNYEDRVAKIKEQSTLEHDILSKKQRQEQQKLPASADLAQKVQEQEALLKTRLQLVAQQNQRDYEEQQKNILLQLLNPEQQEMLNKQKQEVAELDKKFEAQLTEEQTKFLTEKASI